MGKKAEKLQIGLAPEQVFFQGQAFILQVLPYFTLIYPHCLRCPAVEENQTQLWQS